jgi:DNA polymerase-3 subunit delta'
MPFFSHLLGNGPVKELLTQLVGTHKLPSPLLFHGIEGLGKGLFALECAKMLMGKAHIPKINSGNHPDLHIFHTEGKSALHTAESVRSWITEMLIPPFEAPCKVFIIHDAHAMLPTSSNALLKTLEEPPEDTYIFLLSYRVHEILPTILSRCYKIPFFPIPEHEMIPHLQKKYPEADVRRIAFAACGSLKKAEDFLLPNYLEKSKNLHALLSCQLPHDYTQFFRIAEKLDELCTPEEGEEHGGFSLLNDLFAWFRDMALLQTCSGSQIPLYHEEKRESLETKSQRPLLDLEQIFQTIEKGKLALTRHVKLKVILAEILLQSL